MGLCLSHYEFQKITLCIFPSPTRNGSAYELAFEIKTMLFLNISLLFSTSKISHVLRKIYKTLKERSILKLESCNKMI